MEKHPTGSGPWQRIPLEKLKDVMQDRVQTEQIRGRVVRFLATMGRRPRMLLSTVGCDDGQRVINLLATSFARFGFDVDISPRQQNPAQAARMAIESDVHLACMLGGEPHDRRLADQLKRELLSAGGEPIQVIVFYPMPPSSSEVKRQTGDTECIVLDESMGGALLRTIDRLESKTWP